MAKKDYSKYSDEELMKIAGSSASSKFNTQLQNNIGSGVMDFLSSLPNALIGQITNKAKREGIPTPIADFSKGASLGAIQGLADTGLSIANLLRNDKIAHPDIVNENPESIYENIGQISGQSAAPLAIPGISSFKIAQYAPNLISKLLLGAGAGAAEGYAMNEGNRAAGSILGGITGSLGASVPSILGLRSKNIANELSKAKSEKIGEYERHYADLFGSEPKNITVPKINSKQILKNAPSKYTESLQDFTRDPTIEKAHQVQSDLGKLVSYYKKAEKLNPLPSSHLKAMKAAQEAKDSLRKEIKTELENIKTGKARRYEEITKGYSQEVIPYKRNRALTEFEEGSLEPKNLVKKLLKDPKFMAEVSKNHPSLRARNLIEATKNNDLAMKILGYGAGGTAAGLGFYKARDILR